MCIKKLINKAFLKIIDHVILNPIFDPWIKLRIWLGVCLLLSCWNWARNFGQKTTLTLK
jgi:hypothetical protein